MEARAVAWGQMQEPDAEGLPSEATIELEEMTAGVPKDYDQAKEDEEAEAAKLQEAS